MTKYPDAPGYCDTDTSIAAADAIETKLGRLQQKAADAIRLAGEPGLTADELANRLSMDRWSVQRHTSELRRRGFIKDSAIRRLNTIGRKAIVWVSP